MVRQVRKPVKKVRLEAGDISREFEVSHAERILDMGPALNGGWHVPEDSEYEYTEEYGLKLRANKGNSAETSKETADK